MLAPPLTEAERAWYNKRRQVAPWSSGLGRLVLSQEDGGSNPPGATIFYASSPFSLRYSR